MELDGSAAPERPASPDRGRLNLLQSACISLAASRAAAGSPAENGQHGSMERPERGSPAAATAADAAPGNESADADVFFEYDVESGAAGSASGGAADTGCAMTSPAGGSRDLSPVPLPSPDNSAAVAANANVNANASNSVPVDVVVAVDVAAAIADGEPIDAASDSAHAACLAVRTDAGAAGAAADHSACLAEAACAAGAAAAAAVADGAAAAAEPSGGDCQLARSEAVPVPGGGRCGGDYARSADRPSALLHNGRRRAMGGSLPQQSPSEKVDAWLRACREDSGTSTEDEEEAERAAAAESATAAAAAVAAAAVEAEAEVEAAAAKVAEPEPEEPQFQLDGDRASELEDSSETEEMADALGVSDVHDLRVLMARGLQMLELEPDASAAPPAADGDGGEGEQQGAGASGGEQPRRWIGARPRYREHPDRAAAEGGAGGGAEGASAAAAADPTDDVTIEAAIEAAEPDADDEAASTSGASSSFAPPDQLKRSTSLKSGKTPPQTPGRKKFVRFADAMGLDLQRVHTFRDEIPTVPAAAFRGLDMDARAPSPTPPAPDTFQMSFGSAALSAGVSGAPLRQLVPMFLQPGGSLGFLDRLRRDRVVLENVTCNNDDYTVNGVVRVLNMDFHKTVYVRYTLDEWRTSPELRAEYVSGSCDGLSDRFRVSLPAGALQPGERLQFVVRFECQGQVYWDNNGNENYVVQMIRSASASTMDEFGDWSGGRL